MSYPNAEVRKALRPLMKRALEHPDVRGLGKIRFVRKPFWSKKLMSKLAGVYLVDDRDFRKKPNIVVGIPEFLAIPGTPQRLKDQPWRKELLFKTFWHEVGHHAQFKRQGEFPPPASVFSEPEADRYAARVMRAFMKGRKL